MSCSSVEKREDFPKEVAFELGCEAWIEYHLEKAGQVMRVWYDQIHRGLRVHVIYEESTCSRGIGV